MSECLVFYDIADKKRGALAAKILLNFGERIQASVFCVKMAGSSLARLERELRAAMNPDEDSILLVPLCENCQARKIAIGRQKKLRSEQPYLII